MDRQSEAALTAARSVLDSYSMLLAHYERLLAEYSEVMQQYEDLKATLRVGDEEMRKVREAIENMKGA